VKRWFVPDSGAISALQKKPRIGTSGRCRERISASTPSRPYSDRPRARQLKYRPNL